MPRTCTVCGHKERQEIDQALLASEPFRNIAEHFGVSVGALFRHKEHLPSDLANAHEAKEVARADSLLDQVRALQTKTLVILQKAESAGDLRTAIAAIGRCGSPEGHRTDNERHREGDDVMGPSASEIAQALLLTIAPETALHLPRPARRPPLESD